MNDQLYTLHTPISSREGANPSRTRMERIGGMRATGKGAPSLHSLIENS